LIPFSFIHLHFKCTEDPLTEYENMRAVNMMKNNQLFQRLGLGQLKTMITATSANNKQGSPQESGSLYDGENVEDSGEEDVGMVLITLLASSHYLSLLLGSQII
jgi:hypothetical protein